MPRRPLAAPRLSLFRSHGRCLAPVVTRLAVPVMLLGGCALGQRPTLTDERRVDDAAIEAVLERLDAADEATFTATYTITPTLSGSAPAEATVRYSPGRSRITFASGGTVTVEYVNTDGELRTCAAALADCVPDYDDARISNLNVTSSFWGPSSARKLTSDAGRNIADATATTATIAGLPAACADVPVAASEAAPPRYCALDAGPLARYVGPDVTIELTQYEPTVDVAALG